MFSTAERKDAAARDEESGIAIERIFLYTVDKERVDFFWQLFSCVIKRKNTTRRNEKISPKTTDITAAEQAEFIFFGEKTVITVKRETILTLCSNIWQNAGNIFVCLPRK